MEKILIVIVPHCENCYIIQKNLNKALSLISKSIAVETKDYDTIDKNWLKTHRVRDFPTVFLIRDNQVVFKFTGTRPAIVIARYIDEKLFNIHWEDVIESRKHNVEK